MAEPISPNVFGVNFHRVDQRTLIDELVSGARHGPPRYVVPTNLHLVQRLRRDAGLRLAVADPAAIVIADGRPLQWMARLRGINLPLVTGADLVIPLCRAAAAEELSVFLLGSSFTTLAECGRRLSFGIEGLCIAGIYSPPLGFERDPVECELVVSILQAAAPHVIFVALGVPKQEIWARHHTRKLKAQTICVGASLDFIAGTQRRAPRLLRRFGLEWLWRALTQPRRLGLRYLTILVWLPFLVAGDLTAAARRQWARQPR